MAHNEVELNWGAATRISVEQPTSNDPVAARAAVVTRDETELKTGQ